MGYMYALGSIPSLEFGSRPDVTTEEIYLLYLMNFSKKDLAELKVLRRWIDLFNLYRMFQNEEFYDSRGNYVKASLKEYVENEEELPSYVFEYLNDHESEEDRKKYFPKLIAKYFAEEIKEATNPLKEILKFENDWRILIAGFQAKKTKVDLGEVLKYENLADPYVQMSLAQKDSPGPFIFPFEFKKLEEALNKPNMSPTDQMKALAKFRFDFYAEMEFSFPFTLRRLLGYLMQLFQLEELFALDLLEGKKQLQQLMENENAS